MSEYDVIMVAGGPALAKVLAAAGGRVLVLDRGKTGTPNLLVARSAPETGRSLGAQLATAIGLPYFEQSVPYRL